MKLSSNKLFLSLIILIFATVLTTAQEKKPVDKSTRVSPPAFVENTVNNLYLSVDYSQPFVKNRVIWGELVPFDKIWRTGANEATVVTFGSDVVVNGNSLTKGRYSLFTIPSKESWVVVLNNVWDQWGAYKYDEKQDALRFSVIPKTVTEHQEKLTFKIEANDSTSAVITMHWEKLQFSFKVSPKTRE